PGGDGLSGDSLETGCGCGPMYGSVEYLNGPTFDQPLEIQGILVHRTWRGLIDGGDCLPASCTSPTSDYPGLTYEAYLGVMPSFQHAPTSWHGSLFAEGLDDAGLMYRRNRYYDPATGRFTQEDPLGLAGGLNAYGFAGGDPITFSDPFGLCPDPKDPICAFTVHGAYGTTPGVPLLGVGGIGAKVEAYWNKHKDAILQSAAMLLTDGMSSAGDGWDGLSPADLHGKSPEQIEKMVPTDWTRSSSKPAEGGQGTRYAHPTNRGEQIRVMPGDPNAPEGVKRGPYARVSRGGKVSEPIPLAGNPTLPSKELP